MFGTAVILAGGNSTRMGFDKQLLSINNQRLIDIIIDKLQTEFSQIIVVTNRIEYYLKSNYMVIKDKIKGKGPLGGVHSGLVEAQSKFVYFIACDMPNVNIDYIKYMKKKIKQSDVKACITKCGMHIEPFNAFYSRDIISDIEKYLLEGGTSIKPLLRELNIHYIEEDKAREYSPNWGMFLNLNTKEDLGVLKYK